MNLEKEIESRHINLSKHPMYSSLTSLENLRIFMKYHVFAVWDFMSLLKSLQREVTSIDIPWSQSKYSSRLVRLVNEIVLGEESDTDPSGNIDSHFNLYLKAMDEIGADTSLILNFIEKQDFDLLPFQIKTMLAYHLNLAINGKVHEVASSFFYGREKLIPQMFESIVEVIKKENLQCPSLVYYLERHIELDGDEHGPMASRCLEEIISNEQERSEALYIARKSLEVRWDLWSFIQKEIDLQ